MLLAFFLLPYHGVDLVDAPHKGTSFSQLNLSKTQEIPSSAHDAIIKGRTGRKRGRRRVQRELSRGQTPFLQGRRFKSTVIEELLR